MNWFDYAIVGLILLSSAMGGVRGFIKEILSLMTWVLAFQVARSYSPALAQHLTFCGQEILRLIFAVLIIVFLILLSGGLINHILSRLIVRFGFRGPDSWVGAGFGIARAVLFIFLGWAGVEQWDAQKLERYVEQHAVLKNALFLPYLKQGGHYVQKHFVPENWREGIQDWMGPYKTPSKTDKTPSKTEDSKTEKIG